MAPNSKKNKNKGSGSGFEDRDQGSSKSISKDDAMKIALVFFENLDRPSASAANSAISKEDSGTKLTEEYLKAMDMNSIYATSARTGSAFTSSGTPIRNQGLSSKTSASMLRENYLQSLKVAFAVLPDVSPASGFSELSDIEK